MALRCFGFDNERVSVFRNEKELFYLYGTKEFFYPRIRRQGGITVETFMLRALRIQRISKG